MEPWVAIAAGHPVRALVEASAGTGKTYTIERCVVEFVRRGIPIDRILLVTFTEKAAMELRDRVRRILLDEAGRELPSEEWQRMKMAVSFFDSAVITTLHGFAQRVLSWFALYTSYPYEQEVCALEEIFPGLVRERVRGDWERDPRLAEAFRILLEECKGKFEDVVEILQKCVEMPLPLRFSSSLNLEGLLARSKNWGETFQAVFQAAGAKKENTQKWMGFLQNFFQARDLNEALSALAKLHHATRRALLSHCELAIDKLTPPQGDFVREFVHRVEELAELGRAKSHQACLVLVPELRAALEQEKRRRQVMTYGDMIERLDRALCDPELGEPLTARLRERFQVGIVDEFQDTDELQWRILGRVFLENPQASLVVVGDPKQAIYRFRGADIHTYQEAANQLKNGGALVFRLEKNFRCTPAMVKAVNHFFGGDGPHSFFQMQGVAYEAALACGKSGLRLQPDMAPMVFWGQVYCPHVDRRRWRFLLAQQVAREIRRLIGQGVRLEETYETGTVVQHPIDYRDIFILVPKHREGLIVAGELRAMGIPYAFYKRQTLFEGPEARMLVDVLQAIVDPTRASVRHKAFVTPFFGLKVQEIAEAGGVAPEHPAMSFLLDLHDAARQGNTAQVLRCLELDSGVYRRLESFAATRRAAVNLARLMEILRYLISVRLWTLRRVTDALAAWTGGAGIDPELADLAMEVTDPQENAVRILTMHNAKGLEAPVVFLYGGFSDPAPSKVWMYRSPAEGKRVLFAGKLEKEEKDQFKREEAGDLERLMYVAMTRAKALCYLPVIAAEAGGEDADLPDEGREGLWDPTRDWEQVMAERQEIRGKRQETAQTAAERKKKERKKPFFRGVMTPLQQRRAALSGDSGGLYRFRVEERFCSKCGGREEPAGAFAPETPAALGEIAPWREPVVHPGQWISRQSLVFSYSGLKKLGVETMPEEVDESVADLLPEVPEGEPPPGTATGLAVHELCELVDLDELRRHPDAELWMELPGREEAVRRVLRRHGLPEGLWRRFAGMVHAAFQTPVAFGDVRLPPLCQASAMVREAEFRIPWDERLRMRLAQAFPYVPGNSGSLMGYFDALAELDGRLWLVDWKTDLLPDYAPESVYAHVCAHYALQAMVYEEVVARMQSQIPYGGFVYVFVRRELPDQGMVVLPPGWRPNDKII